MSGTYCRVKQYKISVIGCVISQAQSSMTTFAIFLHWGLPLVKIKRVINLCCISHKDHLVNGAPLKLIFQSSDYYFGILRNHLTQHFIYLFIYSFTYLLFFYCFTSLWPSG